MTSYLSKFFRIFVKLPFRETFRVILTDFFDVSREKIAHKYVFICKNNQKAALIMSGHILTMFNFKVDVIHLMILVRIPLSW